MKRPKKNYELSKSDERVMREIYMNVWHEVGEVGGPPAMWFYVVQEFLEYKGYEIVKSGTPSRETD